MPGPSTAGSAMDHTRSQPRRLTHEQARAEQHLATRELSYEGRHRDLADVRA